GEVAHRVYRHEAPQLRLDLLDDHGRAGGHHGDAREALLAVDLGYGEALDVVAAAGEQADHAGEYAGLVVHEHGDGVLLDGAAAAAHVGLLQGRPPPRRAA